MFCVVAVGFIPFLALLLALLKTRRLLAFALLTSLLALLVALPVTLTAMTYDPPRDFEAFPSHTEVAALVAIPGLIMMDIIGMVWGVGLVLTRPLRSPEQE